MTLGDGRSVADRVVRDTLEICYDAWPETVSMGDVGSA